MPPPGLKNHEANDRELKQIVDGLFQADAGGQSQRDFLPEYKMDRKPFNPGRQPYHHDPAAHRPAAAVAGALNRVTPPDFALGGRRAKRRADLHPQTRGRCGCVFRLQPRADPHRHGGHFSRRSARRRSVGTQSPARSDRWKISMQTRKARASRWISSRGNRPSSCSPAPCARQAACASALKTPLPEPMPIAGQWKMKLEGYGFETFETGTRTLASWTDSERTRHFSGTGRYEIEFQLPATQSGGTPE